MAGKKRNSRPVKTESRGGRAEGDYRLTPLDAAAILHPRPMPLAVRIALPVAIGVCAFVTFWPALSAGFVNWDDDKTIVENPNIRGLNFESAFTKSKMGHYHPLTWLSYGVDHAIGEARFSNLNPEQQSRYVSGLDPRVFHLNNLLLHAGVAIAFYFLARLLLRIAFPPPAERVDWLGPLAATVAALLFACHPLRVENAVWVTERRDVLSALFLLPCLHCYLRYVLAEKRGLARWTWYVGSVVLLALSLLSKAWGITLPAVMLLLDYHPLRRIGRKAGWASPRALWAYVDKIPFIGLAAYFAFEAKKAQAAQLATMKSLAEWGVADRVLQAFYGLFFYSWKTLIPTGLTPLHQIPPVRVTDLTEATSPVVREMVNSFVYVSLFAALIVFAVAALLFVLRKRWPAGMILGLIYAGTLSPILGFAQSGPQLVADKYAYIGCLVWPILAGAALIWLWRTREASTRRRDTAVVASGLAVVLCLTYATLAWRQSRIWHDSHTLWSHAVAVDPHCVLARSNLGMLERQRGNLDLAIEHYEAALAVDPTDVILLNNYAHALRQDPARLERAIAIMRQAITLQPKMPDLYYTLANALVDAKRPDEAIAELNTCIRLRRDQPRAKYHHALGSIYMNQRKLDLAEAQFRRALELDEVLEPTGPGVINACNRLGWISINRNQPDQAAAWFNRILQIDPDNRGAQAGLARAQKLTG